MQMVHGLRRHQGTLALEETWCQDCGAADSLVPLLGPEEPTTALTTVEEKALGEWVSEQRGATADTFEVCYLCMADIRMTKGIDPHSEVTAMLWKDDTFRGVQQPRGW